MHKEIFDLITDGFLDRLAEPTLTIIRRTYWTNGLVTEREVVILQSEYNSYYATETKRLKTAPGIITTKYFDKRGRLNQTLPRPNEINPLMAAPYGKAESLWEDLNGPNAAKVNAAIGSIADRQQQKLDER